MIDESTRAGTARSIPDQSERLVWDEVYIDAEADMLLAEASSAICVQRLDDSRNSAIHTTYRISLRSSSLREPRYPLLRVVLGYARDRVAARRQTTEKVMGLVCWGAVAGPGRTRCAGGYRQGIDPSAGSPTETLLRLLLPLENKV